MTYAGEMRIYLTFIIVSLVSGLIVGGTVEFWSDKIPSAMLGKDARKFLIDMNINLCRKRLHDGDYLGTIRACEAVLDLDCNNVIALCNRGLALSNLKQFNGAMDDFNHCLAIAPDDAIVWNARGTLFAKMDRTNEAVGDFRHAIACDPKYTIAQVNFLKWEFNNKKISREEALSRVKKLVEVDPESDFAWFYSGWLKFLAKDYASAVSDSTRAISIDASADAYRVRAYAKSARGQHFEAIEDLTQSIRLNSWSACAYSDRAYERSLLRDQGGALRDYSTALSFDPKDAWVWKSRGRNQFDTECAIRDFTMALSLKPNDSATLEDRGYSYLGCGKYSESISDLSKAIELKPSGWSFAWRGMAYNALGQRDRAIKDCTEAIGLNPGTPAHYMNRAIVYLDLGKYEKSVQDLDKAIELKTSDERAYDLRGYVRRQMGDAAGAFADYKKALSLEPRMFYLPRHHAWDKGKPLQYAQGVSDYLIVSITNPMCFVNTFGILIGDMYNSFRAERASVP